MVRSRGLSRSMSTTPPGAKSYAVGVAKIGLDILDDLSDVLPEIIKPVVNLVQRVVTIAEVP